MVRGPQPTIRAARTRRSLSDADAKEIVASFDALLTWWRDMGAPAAGVRLEV